MSDYNLFKKMKLSEFVEWSTNQLKTKYLPTPPASPELHPSVQMALNPPPQKGFHSDSSTTKTSEHVFQNDSKNGRPTLAELDSQGNPASDTTFDNVPQTPPTGRLSVTIFAGRKLNVNSVHAKPYCVVQFEKNESITQDATREGALPLQRGGQIGGFLRFSACGYESRMEPDCNLVVLSRDVSRLDEEVHVYVYERVQNDQSNEIFLGYLTIKPPRRNNEVIDGWFKLMPRGKDVVSGEMHVKVAYQAVAKTHLTPDSFEILKLIGRGNFGRVFQVRKKDTNRIYAMKVLHKQDLIERREVQHTLAEKNILIQAEACPFLVGLKFSFQTKTHLYLVTDFMNGGELFWHLQNEVTYQKKGDVIGKGDVIDVIDVIGEEGKGRDLKPENILLDATGHIALCDFGLCKENLGAGQTTNTFCGTSEYLAPEVLAECGYGKSVDWWSLGILFYEMIAGFSPFYTHDTQMMYRRILFGKLKFPKGLFSDDAKSLIKGLLARNPGHRLGTHHDAEEIKNHPFFASIDWEALCNKQVSPPFKPNVSSDDDTSCFDPAFTEEETTIDWPTISKTLSRNGTNASEVFSGFTYSGETVVGIGRESATLTNSGN
ncbi:1959_t:CDS:2 [Paraglomus occultum]|uniref:non-specific serine/threonine protein kinase n=1 Tax=Paraglomus occultum TaxID=144539 RepID=A0A9N9FSD5_9GLOM|nr:1959_t:CDS:2 [Paraglomus occultum]